VNARDKLGRRFKDFSQRFLITNINLMKDNSFRSFLGTEIANFRHLLEGHLGCIYEIVHDDDIVPIVQETRQSVTSNVSTATRHQHCSFCHDGAVFVVSFKEPYRFTL
jgi:hypothetical protein